VDSWAQDTLLTPVLYSPAAWENVRLGAEPDFGVLRYPVGDARNRALAESLAAGLQSQRDTSYHMRVLFGAVEAAVPAGTLSVGLCGSTVPASQEQSATQISVYYRAASDSAVARQLAADLREVGYGIGVIEHRLIAANTGGENVRYFYPDDRPMAQSIATITQRTVGNAGFRRFQPVVDDRSSSRESGAPGRFEVWLPDLAPWRSGVAVQIHSRETDRTAVTAALQGLGYPLSRGTPNPGVPADARTNAIWYGRSVPLADVKRVALALMRSGVEIRLIVPFSPPREDRDSMIQVGSLREDERYSSSSLRPRPYTEQEVQAATRFPLR
jgi:hypothetical protein